jgi:hypothetical protein
MSAVYNDPMLRSIANGRQALAAKAAAEAMRAECLGVVDQIISNWREVMHTDDGDLYNEAQITLRTLEPLRSQIAAIKGNGEG